MEIEQPRKRSPKKCSICGTSGHYARTCPTLKSTPGFEDRTFPGAKVSVSDEGAGEEVSSPLSPSSAPSEAERRERKEVFARTIELVFAGLDSSLVKIGVELEPNPVSNRLLAALWAETAEAFGWFDSNMNKWILLGSAGLMTVGTYVPPIYLLRQKQAEKAGAFVPERELERPFAITPPPAPEQAPESSGGSSVC